MRVHSFHVYFAWVLAPWYWHVRWSSAADTLASALLLTDTHTHNDTPSHSVTHFVTFHTLTDSRTRTGYQRTLVLFEAPDSRSLSIKSSSTLNLNALRWVSEWVSGCARGFYCCCCCFNCCCYRLFFLSLLPLLTRYARVLNHHLIFFLYLSPSPARSPSPTNSALLTTAVAN